LTRGFTAKTYFTELISKLFRGKHLGVKCLNKKFEKGRRKTNLLVPALRGRGRRGVVLQFQKELSEKREF